MYSFFTRQNPCEKREVCVSNSMSMVLRICHVCVCIEFVIQLLNHKNAHVSFPVGMVIITEIFAISMPLSTSSPSFQHPTFVSTPALLALVAFQLRPQITGNSGRNLIGAPQHRNRNRNLSAPVTALTLQSLFSFWFSVFIFVLAIFSVIFCVSPYFSKDFTQRTQPY